MDLYYVMTIVDRSKGEQMIKLHNELNLTAVYETLGYGTATSEHLLLYDLQRTDKAIITTIATAPTLKQLIRNAKIKTFIDIPGNGVMMAIPLKTIGGGKNLAYFTLNQELGGKAPAMNFENELIIVVLNEGYSDSVMDAARAAGATGGTVLHAKGTGREHAEKFYGVSLAEEKDMIYILAPTDKKTEIMKAITTQCGRETPMGAVCFSLPVSEVAGLRKLSDD